LADSQFLKWNRIQRGMIKKDLISVIAKDEASLQRGKESRD
jgi:hypothetical protein